MNTTLTDLMRETKNYFPAAVTTGVFTLAEGVLTPGDALQPGAYIAVTGSLHNNGVHRVDESGLIPGAANETWQGRVWLLAPPSAFVALAQAIADWRSAQPAGGVVKEAFGAYSRSVAQSAGGAAVTWQQAFAGDVRPWRRMYTEVNL